MNTPHDPHTGRRTLPPALGLVIAIVLLLLAGGLIVYKQFPEVFASGTGQSPAQGPEVGATGDKLERTGNTPQLDRIDNEFDLAGLTLDRDAIISPRPNKDDIPSLTTADARGPSYQPPAHRHWAQERPPAVAPVADDHGVPANTKVIGVTVNGESRAYPHTVLDRHECVNDVLGGVPIAVTYCPLCDSATVFDRRMGEGDQEVILEFGVSGLLYNSNVLLYDRTHHALWSQVLLTAASGPFAGQPLRYLPGWEITSLDDWAQDHPDGTVLTYDTGLRHYSPQSYAGRGYAGYFASNDLMFPVVHEDDRLPRKTPVIGIVFGDTQRCYQVSAIDGTWADALGEDATLVLEGDGEGGVSIVSMPEGAQVTHTFWYAWVAFHPDTELLTAMPD